VTDRAFEVREDDVSSSEILAQLRKCWQSLRRQVPQDQRLTEGDEAEFGRRTK
jgi:hypothetical protein